MEIKDQLGRILSFTSMPKRIISLVPSQTELLYDLELKDTVIGITKFCVHPSEWFRDKTRIGGTKQLNIELIRVLQPDLILANKEENDKNQLETLMREFPVWISDIYTLQDALDMIGSIGTITGKEKKSSAMIRQIKIAFEELKTFNLKHPIYQSSLETAYLIWRNPWMAAGNKTFIHEMMQYCGLKNCLSDTNRYPEVSWQQVKDKQCKLILLSSEPFPFKEKHATEIREILPGVKILFVDGEMFSWYGSRLLKAPDYFKKIIRQMEAF